MPAISFMPQWNLVDGTNYMSYARGYALRALNWFSTVVIWLVLLICVLNMIVCFYHDDVIKWKHFPRNWPFVRGIHRSPVNSPHKGQWRGALMFSLICVWINYWVNNREAGDLIRYRAHYDVIVMLALQQCQWYNSERRVLCSYQYSKYDKISRDRVGYINDVIQYPVRWCQIVDSHKNLKGKVCIFPIWNVPADAIMMIVCWYGGY